MLKRELYLEYVSGRIVAHPSGVGFFLHRQTMPGRVKTLGPEGLSYKNLINFDRWPAQRAANRVEPRSHRLGHLVQALRRGRRLALRRHGLSGVSAQPDARINLNLAEHRHTVFDRGLRAFTVPENIHGLPAMRT